MSTYGIQPFYNAKPARSLVPMMELRTWATKRRGVGLPFTDFCDALGSVGGDEFEAMCDFGRSRGWNRIEWRGPGVVPEDATPAAEYLGHELDLRPGPERVTKGFTRAARAGARKARESGVVATVSLARESMRAYYALHTRTRRRHGVPPQPWSFFANIQRHMIERGMGFVVLASVSNKPVSGAVFLYFAGRAIYKVGATEMSAQALRPNNLVMATAIERLAEEGLESLHFGRTEVGNEGLRFYKSAWGAREETIRYFRYDLTENLWVKVPPRVSGIFRAIFRHMPISINRALGTVLYPHLD